MLIRMVRFWRSTKLVEICFSSGLPQTAPLIVPQHSPGLYLQLSLFALWFAVEFYQHGVIHVGAEGILNGL